ncbi:MAG: hypothetical protein GXO32_00715 [Crenarchaeota archaeon]|nr:hypothetical protein [Thermoproteota archaeon]
MEVLRTPPRIKVLEALGSIADERIELRGEKSAVVRSSMGDRTYRVCIDVDKGIAYSDDNGTRFRKYIGYPIIALMMLKGLLPYDSEIASALRGIPWKELNEKYKRYFIVERIVKETCRARGIEPGRVDAFVSKVLSALRKYRLMYSSECLEVTDR